MCREVLFGIALHLDYLGGCIDDGSIKATPEEREIVKNLCHRIDGYDNAFHSMGHALSYDAMLRMMIDRLVIFTASLQPSRRKNPMSEKPIPLKMPEYAALPCTREAIDAFLAKHCGPDTHGTRYPDEWYADKNNRVEGRPTGNLRCMVTQGGRMVWVKHDSVNTEKTTL